MRFDQQLYQHLVSTYGIGVGKLASKYQKVSQQECQHKNRLVFLLRCRRRRVFPAFIAYKVEKLLRGQYSQSRAHKGKIDNTNRWLQKRLLNTEIDITSDKLRVCRNQLVSINMDLHTKIPQEEYSQFMDKQRKNALDVYAGHKQRLRRKFDRLVQGEARSLNQTFDSTGIVNYTNIQVPEPTAHILSLGP